MTSFATDSYLATDTPVDPDLARGQRVGEYEVDGKLGQGAFGSVFRAVHPLIGKEVAIKVLARKFSVDPEMVSRFIAEARAVNQIRHRHIIDIFSFGQLEDGRHYYVMEYLDGEALDAAIEREGRLPLAAAIPILHGIGRALDAAHAKGIAHRDLKAENVFLGRDPDGAVFPKLLDFGIAKLMAPEEDEPKHKTRTGTPVGTPYYMSPEQCRGRDVDHRTDLYAFGVLAYRMLTGSYPLDADDYMSILIRQLSDTPVPASQLVPELPKGVDDALAWLMAKEPAHRPPNVRAALAAIVAAAVEAGIAVSPEWDVPSGPHGRVGTQPTPAAPAMGSGSAPALGSGELRPRRRGWIVLVALLALVAGVAAMLVTIELREPEPARGQGQAVAVQAAASAAPVAAAQAQAATSGASSPGAPQPPPPPGPAAVEHVIVTVAGVPDDTEVTIGNTSVGVAPGPVQLPRGARALVLTFKAAGHIPASRTITPDQDRSLAVALKRRPAAPVGAKRPAKDDIIDVFPGRSP